MKNILILGDSLGAKENFGFPVLVQRELEEKGQTCDITNSSAPSSNVLDLLDRTYELLPTSSDFSDAVVQVGINDSKILAGGFDPLVELDWFSSRLEKLCRRLERDAIRVHLCGLPCLDFSTIKDSDFLDPYWSWDVPLYQRYDATIQQVARYRSRRYLSLWDIFEQDASELFESDGVHPNQRGHALIASRVSTSLMD